MKWSWLRVGRRIEWVTAGLFLFAFLLFGFIGASSQDFVVEFMIGIVGLIVALPTLLPVYLLLRRRRRQEAEGVSDTRAQSRNLSRAQLYSLLFMLTLISAAVQAGYGMVPIAGSVRGFISGISGYLPSSSFGMNC